MAFSAGGQAWQSKGSQPMVGKLCPCEQTSLKWEGLRVQLSLPRMSPVEWGLVWG